MRLRSFVSRRWGQVSPRIFSSSALGLLRLLGAGLTYLMQGWLARLCGAEEFGIYAFGWSLVMFAATVANLGLRAVLMRFIPEYVEKGGGGKTKGFLIFANSAILTATVIIGASLMIVKLLFPNLFDIIPRNTLFIYLWLLPVLAAMYFWIDMAIPLGAALLGYGMYSIAFTLLFALLVLFLHLADVHVDAASVGAALGIALTVTSLSLAAALCWRAPLRALRRLPATFEFRRWVAVMPALFAASLFEVAQRHIHIVVAGVSLDPAEVGVIYAATRSALVLELLCSGYAAMAAPVLARHFHAGLTLGLRNEFRKTAAALLLLAAAAIIAVIALGDVILHVFGTGFERGYGTLVGLSIAIAFRYAIGPAIPLMLIADMPKGLLSSMAASSVLNGLISAVCLPRYGLEGAWIGPTVGMMAGTVIIAVQTWRRFGVFGMFCSRQVRP